MTLDKIVAFLKKQGFELNVDSQEWEFFITGDLVETVKLLSNSWVYRDLTDNESTQTGTDFAALEKLLLSQY